MTYEELYLAFLDWMDDTELRIHVDGSTIDITAGVAMKRYGSCTVKYFDKYEVELEN